MGEPDPALTSPGPKKRFGQHFLHDPGIISRIIQSLDPDPALTLVEIGPGKGALTFPLLQGNTRLDVIEIDRSLARLLEDRCPEGGELRVHVCNALDFDFSSIGPPPLQIIGNLPYNISTPLLFHLLNHASFIRVMVLMLQEEVVQRMCAGVDSRDFGRLSVMLQSRCEVEKLFTVPAGAFNPPPKVTSAVVRLRPDPTRLRSIKNPVLFETLVRQAFNQRRKTLHNALAGSVTDSVLEALGISPRVRPQTVTVDDWIRIANALDEQQNQ